MKQQWQIPRLGPSGLISGDDSCAADVDEVYLKRPPDGFLVMSP